MSKADGRKAIFITGAASGMGRETALLFRQKDWFVGCYDVNTAGLKSLAEELGEKNCLARQLDVTNRDDYRTALADFADASEGKLDILFCKHSPIGNGIVMVESKVIVAAKKVKLRIALFISVSDRQRSNRILCANGKREFGKLANKSDLVVSNLLAVDIF